jgi:hypothetical protein
VVADGDRVCIVGESAVAVYGGDESLDRPGESCFHWGVCPVCLVVDVDWSWKENL